MCSVHVFIYCAELAVHVKRACVHVLCRAISAKLITFFFNLMT